MVFDLFDLMLSNLRLDLIAGDLISEMGLYRWNWKAANGNALVNYASAGRNLPFIHTNPIDLSFTKLLMWW